MNAIQISALVGLLLSFPSIYIASKRLINEKDFLSSVIFLITAFFCATLISAYFHSDIPITPLAASQTSNSLSFLAIALAFAAVTIDAALFMIAKYTYRRNIGKTIIILLIAFVGVNLLAAIVCSLLFHMSFDKSFFFSCCASLGVSGMAWGLTYEEISVIGNIYMQLAILLGSALFVAYAAIKRYKTNRNSTNTFIMVCGITYALIYCVFSVWVISHYAMPLNDAFVLCFHDLVFLAHKYNTTYNIINYIIFIVGFLVFTIGNILIALSLKPRNENRSDLSQKALDLT